MNIESITKTAIEYLTRALKESLEKAGCSIPYPQQDLHLHQSIQ